MRKTLLWLFAAILIIGVVGVRWQVGWEYFFGGVSPLWSDVVSYLQWLDRQLIEWGMFPTTTAIGLIGLFITWLWPDIWDKITGYDKFLARLIAVYPENKGKFHMTLNRAYDVWKLNNADMPDKLDELIDKTHPKPNGLMFSNKVADVERALKFSNSELWDFCEQLYSEIESTLRNVSYTPTLLTRDDYMEFTKARKNLVDFWNTEGRRIYSAIGRLFLTWTFYRIDEHLTDRSLVIFPFLETALAKQISKRVAARYVFRLSGRAFKLWHVANTSA